MGNKESVSLSQKDVTLCANLAIQSHTDVDTIKLVLSEWKKKGGDAESKGLTSAQKLYEFLCRLHYFDGQTTAILDRISGLDEAKKQVFRDLMLETLQSPEYQKKQAKELFKSFDKDHNGEVSFKEFLSGFLVTTSGDAMEQAALQFDVWDTDNNGVLTKEEVRSLWASLYDSSVAINKIQLATNLTVNVFQSANDLHLKGSPETLTKLAKTLFKRILKVVESHLEVRAAAVHKHESDIVNRIFQLADSDANGMLSKKEFILYSVDPAISANVKELTNLLADAAGDTGKFSEKINQVILEFTNENRAFFS